MQLPDFSLELMHSKLGFVAGVDEAGRGPWAGPVVAAAAILDSKNCPQGINDSKKLSKPKREFLAKLLLANFNIGIGIAEVAEIEELNILGATKLAMQRAIANLQDKPAVVLIDGNQPINIDCKVVTIVKGDSKSLSIAAASIVAKVTRDNIMSDLAKLHPEYSWQKNSGYGTADHIAAIKEHGITKHHRKNFAPISEFLIRGGSR